MKLLIKTRHDTDWFSEKQVLAEDMKLALADFDQNGDRVRLIFKNGSRSVINSNDIISIALVEEDETPEAPAATGSGFRIDEVLRGVFEGELPEGDYSSNEGLIHVQKDRAQIYYGDYHKNERYFYTGKEDSE